jgi:peptidoglycan hydrolase-like protein with peptidoglycan-binding domain
MNPELQTLYPWDQGGRVMELQELLRAHGFDGVRVNGDFDRFTEAAVKSYQHQQGLRIDGVVGEKTWTALTASVQPGTRSLKSGCWGADVCELQGLLLVHGFNIRRSRMFDEETEAAVREFQERSRLQPNGIVDGTTWTFLRGRGLSSPPPKQNRWLSNPRKWW